MNIYLKRIFLTIFVLLVMGIAFSGCNFSIPDVDDSEERTYEDTVYEVAYSASKKDGLRAKVYYRFLFDETDKKVLRCIHLTAGNGRTTILKGTYEGELSEQIKIQFDSGVEEIYKFENEHMVSEDGNESYSKTSVPSAINDIVLWD